MIYLAGDIGGTKCHLALYREGGVEERRKKFPSQKYPSLSAVVEEFLKGEEKEISKACFGVAGPVNKGKSQATNLPWLIDEEKLKQELSIPKVSLINDLEANAYGLNLLKEEECYLLNRGDPKGEGNRAMVSAGTGLGEAGMYFDGKKYHPFACEGGHASFAPRNSLEEALLAYLRKKFGHVSCERVLSGVGLYNLYRFIVDTKQEEEKEETFQAIEKEKSPKLISEWGLSGESKACSKALELFVSIYGAEAGNMALKMLALGGVYIGGGIAPKILEVFKTGRFLESFIDKGRLSDLLKKIPIRVILNEDTALLGARYYTEQIL